jgi:sortase A
VYGRVPGGGEPLARNRDAAPVTSTVVRRTAAGVGRMLVTVGLLILLFVAYQLWGTGIFTDRAQSDLRHQFRQELQDNPTVTSTSSTSAPPRSTAPTTTAPRSTVPKVVQVVQEGGPVGRIRIPKIGVDQIVVQGTSRPDLAKGPGHYPATPMPGQIGNAAIAGHRTTHAKPFYNLNELKPGDDIIVDTVYGSFTYRMYQQLIVSPHDVSVVDPTPDAELTLTTCNPRFSARQRMVVKARLVVNKSAPARKTVPIEVVKPVRSDGAAKSSLKDSLSGDISSRTPTLIWGTITLLLGLAWWWVYRRWRLPLTWVVGVVPFLAVLFAFYVYFERLLPANF